MQYRNRRVFSVIYAICVEKKTEIELKKGEMRKKTEENRFLFPEKKRKNGIFRFFSEILKHY